MKKSILALIMCTNFFAGAVARAASPVEDAKYGLQILAGIEKNPGDNEIVILKRLFNSIIGNIERDPGVCYPNLRIQGSFRGTCNNNGATQEASRDCLSRGYSQTRVLGSNLHWESFTCSYVAECLK